MDKDNLNLQVVVNGEVNLRGDEFNMQDSNRQTSSKKTNNAVKRAGDVGDKKSFAVQDVNFARNVRLATGKRNLIHRHRNATIQNKPVSADPRFRRRRSPERLPNTSQSTAVLETTSDQLNDKIIKSHSASSPAFNMNHKRKHLEMLTLEQGTMTNVTQQNDVPLRRSDESPYWNDPRLEKYCNVLKPVPVLQTRKSFTCPKCFCEREQTVYCESNKNDDCTVIDDGGLSEKTINTEFAKNPDLLTPSMILGSVCGLIIVSLLIWLVNPTELWRYYRTNRVEKDTSTGLAYIRS